MLCYAYAGICGVSSSEFDVHKLINVQVGDKAYTHLTLMSYIRWSWGKFMFEVGMPQKSGAASAKDAWLRVLGQHHSQPPWRAAMPCLLPHRRMLQGRQRAYLHAMRQLRLLCTLWNSHEIHMLGNCSSCSEQPHTALPLIISIPPWTKYCLLAWSLQ